MVLPKSHQASSPLLAPPIDAPWSPHSHVRAFYVFSPVGTQSAFSPSNISPKPKPGLASANTAAAGPTPQPARA
jgi:hypothetical protein